MKRISIALVIIIMIISAFYLQRDNNYTENEDNTVDTPEIEILEKPATIDTLFTNFSNKFNTDAVMQNTAFQWNDQLLNGFRMRLNDSSISSSDIISFFQTEGFEANEENTTQEDSQWNKGFTLGNLICLVKGSNGNIENNTRDIVVNCAEEDQVI